MDTSGLNAVDVIVFVVVAIFGLLCFGWGLVRLVLIVAVWVGAMAAAINLVDPVMPSVLQFVNTDTIPEIAAKVGVGLVLFVIGLIVLSILGNIVLNAINHGKPLGPVDRSLGLLVGLGLGGAFIVSIYFVILAVIPSEDHPTWLRQARTQPFLAEGAAFIGAQLPERYQQTMGEKIEGARRLGTDAQTIEDAMDRIVSPPPKADAPAGDSGYNGTTGAGGDVVPVEPRQ